MKTLEQEGFKLTVSEELAEKEDSLFYTVVATNKAGEKAGEYVFKKTLPSDEARILPENSLVAVDASTEEDYRRKGIATWAYCFIEEYTGLVLVSDKRVMAQTDDGRAFWSQKDRPFGKN